MASAERSRHRHLRLLTPSTLNTLQQLKGLTPAKWALGVDTAQRFLAGAYDSVEALLETLSTLRKLRREQRGDIRGRIPENEADLLRAAVVFTGAGLDATLKQLIRDTLPTLLESNVQSQQKFEKFAIGRLGTGEIADTTMLARYLTAPNPRDGLSRITYTTSLAQVFSQTTRSSKSPAHSESTTKYSVPASRN